jgi:hypothetical protein
LRHRRSSDEEPANSNSRFSCPAAVRGIARRTSSESGERGGRKSEHSDSTGEAGELSPAGASERSGVPSHGIVGRKRSETSYSSSPVSTQRRRIADEGCQRSKPVIRGAGCSSPHVRICRGGARRAIASVYPTRLRLGALHVIPGNRLAASASARGTGRAAYTKVVSRAEGNASIQMCRGASVTRKPQLRPARTACSLARMPKHESKGIAHGIAMTPAPSLYVKRGGC